MDFLIADTFSDSLARLSGEEQKSVKTTAFDLQMNPANPGMSFHRLDRAKDKNFWSVRAGSDIRIIVHRDAATLLLCYVDHHDKAYRWAESRKLSVHPKTGAAQMVELRESVQEIRIPKYVEVAAPPTPKPRLFQDTPQEDLLSYGVPPEWIEEVRKANEDSLLGLADHLPSEAAESLLELATGGKPKVPSPTKLPDSPFHHPDSQRRFRIMKSSEELQKALELPWDKWTIFLHPDQRDIVEKQFNGPAKVAGSAGTGKTIVALHRAVFLARKHSDARVLLTTFSDPLASMLRTRLRRLISTEPRLGDRIDVYSIEAIGARLYEKYFGKPSFVTRKSLLDQLQSSSSKSEKYSFSIQFLASEWDDVIDSWQITSWDQYREFKRLGRKTRLPELQRAALWTIFSDTIDSLQAQCLITSSGMFSAIAKEIPKQPNPIFDFVIIDEAQDLRPQHLHFLAALAGGRLNGLFFAGDLGQRIFQTPFSWKAFGIDVRGKSKTLRVNYRTSHQIRHHVDKLLPGVMSDVDGNAEERVGTVSAFNGPAPEIQKFDDNAKEAEFVGNWIGLQIKNGCMPQEIGVFVRSDSQIDRAKAALQNAGISFTCLDQKTDVPSSSVTISTMHLAKGLEFKSVVVMACDDEVIPLQDRIESVGDESDLEEIYSTERHLLYVACTRARDRLLITSGNRPSEFLDDLRRS
jgi:mRNA-degrading endonuclease RelE of RelBE toxin-antitoxin system